MSKPDKIDCIFGVEYNAESNIGYSCLSQPVVLSLSEKQDLFIQRFENNRYLNSLFAISKKFNLIKDLYL